MVHPKTRLISHKTGGCSTEHPYNLIVIRLLESLNSYDFSCPTENLLTDLDKIKNWLL